MPGMQLARTRNRRWAVIAGVALLAACVLAVIHGYREAVQRPLVVRYHIVPKAVPDGPPLRVVFMTDTHAGQPDMPPARLGGIVDRVNAMRPDLVLLGGDYVKGLPFDIGGIPVGQALAPLYGLKARLGVVAVLGNNDCAHGQGDRIAGQMKRNGITVLRNQALLLPTIAILGIDDGVHCKGNVGPARISFEKQIRAKGLENWHGAILMLSHEPVFASYAPDYVDLSLSGHTHGGQLFPLLTASIIARHNYLPAARGMMKTLTDKPLIISSGVGTNNLPLRIGVPPEIILLTIGRQAE